MEEVDLQKGVTGDEFIDETYDYVVSRNRREDGVYPSDFLCDMFCSNDGFWWMTREHPISRMLEQNEFYPESCSQSKYGDIVVYADLEVKQCRDCIVQLCEKYNKKIIKNGGI